MFGEISPLEQNAVNYITGYSPSLEIGNGFSGLAAPYEMLQPDAYPQYENTFAGSHFNNLDELINPYDVMTGWVDSQNDIHDAVWGNTIGFVDEYANIRDQFGSVMGSINPYGQVISPYSFGGI